MTIHEATFFLLNKLRTIYPQGEASQITDWVMEYITGSQKAERMLYKNEAITSKEATQLKQFTERLMQREPVQYILNESWFCGLKLYVDQNVLIPRPETEELVEWLLQETRNENNETRHTESAISILDIGAGSGCIPIILKKKLNKAEIWSCDISEGALQVAQRNAGTIGVNINFLLLDFLNAEQRDRLPSFDIIISNPPYVPEKDKEQMQPNVLMHEPHTALFVPDNDTIIFYKAIAEFGKNHLKPEGVVYAEIHEDRGNAVAALFTSMGYKTELRKDMQGKPRMLKATKH